MPSQQVPTSLKVESLPAEQRAIAERLIKAKFKITDRPKNTTVKVKAKDIFRDTVQRTRYVWRLRAVDRSRNYPEVYEMMKTQSMYNSSYLGYKDLPRTIQYECMSNTNPAAIATWLTEELFHLERKFGVVFQATPEGEAPGRWNHNDIERGQRSNDQQVNVMGYGKFW